MEEPVQTEAKASSKAPPASKLRRKRKANPKPKPAATSNAQASKPTKKANAKNDGLVATLSLIDPFLQFLTKASGQTTVPFSLLAATIPNNARKELILQHIQELASFGVLRILQQPSAMGKPLSWDCKETKIGFPEPPSTSGEGRRLHGSSKTAAKRRLVALKHRALKQQQQESLNENGPRKEALGNAGEENSISSVRSTDSVIESSSKKTDSSSTEAAKKTWEMPSDEDSDFEPEEIVLEDERKARRVLQEMFHFSPMKTAKIHSVDTKANISYICPKQASYAGSTPAQDSRFRSLHAAALDKLTPSLLDAFDIDHPLARLSNSNKKRSLYLHQAEAIQSALDDTNTLVCTGTGSGKSICFLLPVLQAALNGHTSFIIFPTKALAQDQLTKLQSIIGSDPELQKQIIPATLDGDCSHSQRSLIAAAANVILTNPDTLHSAILPNWRNLYRPLLERLKYVVIDEAHMYEGIFGSHVSMVLARLYRIFLLSSSSSHENKNENDTLPTNTPRRMIFLACSATMAHPEHHIRLLCPVPKDVTWKTLINKDDGSPRAAKHFFVWNPPLLDINGVSLGKVVLSTRSTKKATAEKNQETAGSSALMDDGGGPVSLSEPSSNGNNEIKITSGHEGRHKTHRRHSADETALLLARAVAKGIRCIAFCKTRGLVEWVYERAIRALKSDPATKDLASKIESYRGGYSRIDRRAIEQRLFSRDLLGVVGTSALELGVDIGGLDLTLHCGYPQNHASLLQQAGRAGRGKSNIQPSVAIIVCFNSPIDQHLWRHPRSLLERGLSAKLNMPIFPGLVKSHLLCAASKEEFPLVKGLCVSNVVTLSEQSRCEGLPDSQLFGPSDVFTEAFESLYTAGSFVEEKVSIAGETVTEAKLFRTHGTVEKPWSKVSLRSIEPLNYDIIDLSHPKQAGRMDGAQDESAIIDTVPYSRVFYHAFPGAIIMHRGQRYKIVSMVKPPAFANQISGRSSINLAAYAKPSSHGYFTRPLSTLKITVVKQLERIEHMRPSNIPSNRPEEKQEIAPAIVNVDHLYSHEDDPSIGSFAGCGVVTVRRNVHGYKKLSLVTREELSRSELSLPDMEYDSFAFWLDCDAGVFSTLLGKDYGHGIHALSHAILAVAPLFVPCTPADIQCDHSFVNPTRVTIFDARPGGSGVCSQLWKHVFVPNGLIDAAVDLLRKCPSCSSDVGYYGGCPGCIQFGECIKFNDFLCKEKALAIGKHLLKRIQQLDIYKAKSKKMEDNMGEDSEEEHMKEPECTISSPRRRKRARAMQAAKDIAKSQDRQLVIGRPSWPMDGAAGDATHRLRQEFA